MSELHFAISLKNGANPPNGGWPKVEFILKGDAFQFVPVAAILKPDGKTFEANSEQWRVAHREETKATVTIGGASFNAVLSQATPEKDHLQIDVARLGTESDKQGLLLRGSIRIPFDPTQPNPEFNKQIAGLWPTGRVADVSAIRLEPAGLYLEGKLPAAIFPPFPLESGLAVQEGMVPVVLRVPQHSRDLDTNVPFWTLEAFEFDKALPTASQFLRYYAEAIESFRSGDDDGVTFIDNVVLRPEPDCSIRISVEGPNLSWNAPNLRQQLRIQLRPQTTAQIPAVGEAVFFPTRISGKAKIADGTRILSQLWGSDDGSSKSHIWLHYVPKGDAPAQPAIVELALHKTAQDLLLGHQELAALDLPMAPIIDEEGAGERGRAWLCTGTGWLSVDKTLEKQRLDTALQSPGAIRGVVELFKFQKALAGGKAGYDALQVQVSSLAETAVGLGIDFSEPAEHEIETLRLTLLNPMMTVITPTVWHLPRVAESQAGDGDVEQPRRIAGLPSLLEDGDAESGKPENLFLHQATFVSKRLLKNQTPAPCLEAELDFEEEEGFSLQLNVDEALRMRVWQPVKDVPLVQTYGLTADANRGGYLDANRGLIPFRSEEQKKIITISFPDNALPEIGEPAPEWDDLKDWRLDEDFLYMPYFLPTLPGVEATLNRKDENYHLRWVFRHGVPALDEAFAEVSEEADAVGYRPGSLDFTRVQGSVAFEIHPEDSDKANGWLPKEDGRRSRETKITNLVFEPAKPELKFELSDAIEGREQTFGRESNVAGLNAVFRLLFDGKDRKVKITNNGQALIKINNAPEENSPIKTLDGEGVVQQEYSGPRSDDGRWTGTLAYGSDDGDHLVLELAGVREGDYDEKADLGDQSWMLHDGQGGWPVIQGWPLYPLRLTKLNVNGDELKIEIEAVLLPRPPEPAVISLVSSESEGVGVTTDDSWEVTLPGQGTNLDGTFEVTFKPDVKEFLFSLSHPYLALDIPEVTVTKAGDSKGVVVPPEPRVSATKLEYKIETPEGATYTIRIKTPARRPAEQGLALASKSLTLTLTANKDELSASLAELKGDIAWNFAGASGDAPVRLEHLETTVSTKGQLANDPFMQFDGNISQPRPVNGVLQFPLGLLEIKLHGSRGLAGLDRTHTVNLPEDGKGLTYEIALKTYDEFSNNPYVVDWCQLTWSYPIKGDEEEIVAKLVYSYGSNPEAGAASKKTREEAWEFSLYSGTDRLGNGYKLEHFDSDAGQILFKVVDSDEPGGNDRNGKAWLTETDSASGIIGVTFSEDFGTIKDLAAEIQLTLSDRYPDDAILIWDPEAKKLHTMDKNVGAFAGKRMDADGDDSALSSLGPAALSRVDDNKPGEWLFWPDGENQLRRWKKKLDNGVAPIAIQDLTENDEIVLGFLTVDFASRLLAFTKSGDKYRVYSIEITQDPSEKLGRAEKLGTSGEPIHEGVEQRFMGAATKNGRVVWSQGNQFFGWISNDNRSHTATLADGTHIIASAFIEENLVWTVNSVEGTKKLQAWKLDSGQISPAEILSEDMGDIVALAALGEGSPYVITGHANGVLKLRKRTSPIEEVKELETLRSASIRALVSLESGATTEIVRFAALYDDGSVIQYEYKDEVNFKDISPRAIPIFTGDCKPTRISVAAGFNNAYSLLVMAGPTARSQLTAVLSIYSDDKDSDKRKLRLHVSGRWVIQNRIDFRVDRVDDALRKPLCHHRLDLYFDRAEVPLEAIFWGEHARPQDHFAAAVAQHTFRFDEGQERIWQAPQTVRFTPLERYLTEGVTDETKTHLVLDAGAVFWLKKAEKVDQEYMRHGVAAAMIDNYKFRMELLPRELHTFDSGEIGAVRLPVAATWAFNNAPLEYGRSDETVPTTPEIHMKEPADDSDPDKLAYASSGSQHSLINGEAFMKIAKVNPPLAMLDNRPTFFDRGSEAAWLDATYLLYSLQPETTRDELWKRLQRGLDEENAQTAEEVALDLVPAAGASPANFVTDAVTPVIGGDLNDLMWLYKGNRPENDTLFIRGDSEYLASATLTYKFDTSAGVPQSLSGPALFEFPYRVRFAMSNAENKAENQRSEAHVQLENRRSEAHVQLENRRSEAHVQLLIFEAGKIRLLANARVPYGAQTKEQPAISWAQAELERRRRTDRAFIMFDFSEIYAVPRSFDVYYQTAPAERTWPLAAAEDAQLRDPRLVLPNLSEEIDSEWPKPWFRRYLVANADLGLRLFAAEPSQAPESQEGTRNVGASRFRLAPGGKDAAGKLARAQTIPDPALESTRQEKYLIVTQRDDVPFEVYSEEGIEYPKPWSRIFHNRPAVVQQQGESDELAYDNETTRSVLPPLIDVVSWAARPGEMIRSSWMLDKLVGRKESEETGLRRYAIETRHPVGASLRRPRAKAGSTESVRVEALEAPPLDSSRFCRRSFILTQVLEETELPTDNNIQMVLATNGAIFKAVQEPALIGADPVRLYYEEPEPGSVVLEEFGLYLLADEIEKDIGVEGDGEWTSTKLVWTKGLLKEEDLVDTIDTQNGNLKPDVLEAVLLSIPDDPEKWEEVLQSPTPPFCLRISDSAIVENSTYIEEHKEFYLQVIRYSVTNPTGANPPTYALDSGNTKILASLRLDLLNVAGRFTPPPLSVSLLANVNGAESSFLLGYGRLKGEAFSMIKPTLEEKPTEGGAPVQFVAWQRTAPLHILQRQRQDNVEGDYDVVVYGPGGELIPTRRIEQSDGA